MFASRRKLRHLFLAAMVLAFAPVAGAQTASSSTKSVMVPQTLEGNFQPAVVRTNQPPTAFPAGVGSTIAPASATPPPNQAKPALPLMINTANTTPAAANSGMASSIMQALQGMFTNANNNGGAAKGPIPSFTGESYPQTQPPNLPQGQHWYSPGAANPPTSFQGSLPSNFNDCSNPEGKTDLECMVCNIYFEARDQSIPGQVEVGRTVLTRVKSPHYPRGICENVYAYKQFSWTLLLKRPIIMHDQKSIRAAEYAARQALAQGPNGMDSYYAYKLVNPSWGRSCQPKNYIGGHVFCSVKGDDVALGSFAGAITTANDSGSTGIR